MDSIRKLGKRQAIEEDAEKQDNSDKCLKTEQRGDADNESGWRECVREREVVVGSEDISSHLF